ncbi:MAG: Gx transporter family protein [Blautia sp.]|nr:Gx transporter family protein [Blautia sp.]
MKSSTQHLAFLAMFTSVAIIFGYVEHLFPIVPSNPFIKLGLANLAVLFILNKYSLKDAALVSCVRIIVVNTIFGTFSAMIWAFAGAALSLLVMAALLRYTDLSLIGISVAGGVAHNIGQLIADALIVQNPHILRLFPILIVTGIITGLLIGYLTQEVSRRVHVEGEKKR